MKKFAPIPLCDNTETPLFLLLNHSEIGQKMFHLNMPKKVEGENNQAVSKNKNLFKKINTFLFF
ncbi:hypothetical protein SAMN05421690_11202 [Nitrosomonas sp. Nm51]|nr:hypothetical protein SAMN05421690_11202 [Nitrosomonas sp. Nm51]